MGGRSQKTFMLMWYENIYYISAIKFFFFIYLFDIHISGYLESTTHSTSVRFAPFAWCVSFLADEITLLA